MYINKVGKRWFIVVKSNPGGRSCMIDVEASYANGTDWTGAKYEPVTKWTLTGKGSKRYRKEIIEELEKKLEWGEEA